MTTALAPLSIEQALELVRPALQLDQAPFDAVASEKEARARDLVALRTQELLQATERLPNGTCGACHRPCPGAFCSQKCAESYAEQSNELVATLQQAMDTEIDGAWRLAEGMYRDAQTQALIATDRANLRRAFLTIKRTA